MDFKKISIVGLGYIGLPTAAMFASKEVDVVGFDIDKNIVETINKGKIHIVEPGLQEIVKIAVDRSFLRASLEVIPADVFIIAVPTPLTLTKTPDLSHLEDAIRKIAPVLKSGNLVVLESTVPVGTTENIANLLSDLRPDLTFPNSFGTEQDVFIAHCPERVLPGNILSELQTNDRVIGGITEKCALKSKQLYEKFVNGKFLLTDIRTAEMAKLAENSFRDVNIAFANELSMLCKDFEIDVNKLIATANHHPRVNILKPGPGVGGHCIAVDPWFLVNTFGSDAKLIHEARMVNERKTEWVVTQIKVEVKKFKAKHKIQPKLACLGLAFKPDIDDLRESPSLKVYRNLIQLGYEVFAVEPNLNSHPDFKLFDLKLAISQSDIVVALVAHKEFRVIESSPKVLDFCGILSED